MFIFIIRRGLSFIEDTELLENLEVDRNDKLKMDHLLDEAFIMFLYSAILAVTGVNISQDGSLEAKILDIMHNHFFLFYQKEKSKNINTLLIERYLEYEKALKEKRGPNWLWPLTSHILDNMKQEKVEDWVSMLMVTSHLVATIDAIRSLIKDLVKKYDSDEEQFRNRDIKFYYRAGVSFYKLRLYQQSIDHFKQAALINPEFIKTYFYMGLAYLSIGEKYLALEQYDILKLKDINLSNRLFRKIFE